MSDNPVLVATGPSLIAALKAVEQFTVDIGTNPVQWALTVPGALAKLLGTVEMQIPTVIGSEAGALQAFVTSKVEDLIKKIQAAGG